MKPTETAGDVKSGTFAAPIVHYKPVAFKLHLNRSQEIPSEAVGGGIFDRFVFLKFDNCQLEVASDVISDMAVQYVSMDVCVKFGDSKSNRSGDIRLLTL